MSDVFLCLLYLIKQTFRFSTYPQNAHKSLCGGTAEACDVIICVRYYFIRHNVRGPFVIGNGEVRRKQYRRRKKRSAAPKRAAAQIRGRTDSGAGRGKPGRETPDARSPSRRWHTPTFPAVERLTYGTSSPPAGEYPQAARPPG